jgi:hypothetical protein
MVGAVFRRIGARRIQDIYLAATTFSEETIVARNGTNLALALAFLPAREVRNLDNRQAKATFSP